MKKILFVLLSFFIISSTCFAHRTAYEPESDNAASFSAFNLDNGENEISFVKYATIDKLNNEYWIRFSVRRSQNKILHYSTLIIDGVEYHLRAMENPSEKYIRAGQSLIDTSNSAFFGATARSDYRYFPISSDIAEKIKLAQTMSFKFNLVTSINNKFNIPDDFLKSIQDVFLLEYPDLEKLWNPKDRS